MPYTFAAIIARAIVSDFALLLGGNVFATIDFQSSAEQDTSKEHYFLISYHSLENVAVTVKFHTSEVKNTSYESLQKRLVTRKSFSSNLGFVFCTYSLHIAECCNQFDNCHYLDEVFLNACCL